MSETITPKVVDVSPENDENHRRFRREFPGALIEITVEELAAIAKVDRVGVGDDPFAASLLLAALRSSSRLYFALWATADRWGIIPPEDTETP